MGQPYGGGGTFRDPVQDELERIGMMLEGYLQDMDRFSVDTGHLLQHKTPATRMFKGINMLWVMQIQYGRLHEEAKTRKMPNGDEGDKDGMALYKWFVDFFSEIIESSLRNFHPYQKAPRVYLTPRFTPKGGKQESMVRAPWRERISNLLKSKSGEAPLDMPSAPEPKMLEGKVTRIDKED